jgi:hypothetical protein
MPTKLPPQVAAAFDAALVTIAAMATDLAELKAERWALLELLEKTIKNFMQDLSFFGLGNLIEPFVVGTHQLSHNFRNVLQGFIRLLANVHVA